MNVALMGTGLMGVPMALRLAAVGHRVTVYNRSRSKTETLAREGVSVAETPAAAIQVAECVLLTLSDEAAIRALLLEGAAWQVLEGRTVIQMGTIAPGQSQRLLRDMNAAGGDYFEAPVLGSVPEATAGRLIVMVGASPEQFERYRPLLQAFGPEPVLIGPVGQAAAVKLALNQLIATLTAAFSLSLGFVQRQGVAAETLMGILRESALYAPTFDKKLSRMLSHDYAGPNFPTKHLAKDVDLFLDESANLGLDTGLLEGVREAIQATLDKGLAEMDYSALFEGITGARAE